MSDTLTIPHVSVREAKFSIDREWQPPRIDDLGMLRELECLSALVPLMISRKRPQAQRTYGLGKYYDLARLTEDDQVAWIAALSENGLALSLAPLAIKLDADFCALAVQQNGAALDSVPHAGRNRSICLSAVSNDGLTLVYVPAEFRDYSLCLVAVMNDGLALGFVPEDVRDHKICWSAVHNNGLALKFVPKRIRDMDMCLDAIIQDTRAILFAYEQHPAIITSTEFKQAVQKSRQIHLEMLPPSLVTEALCLKAVSSHGRAVSRVPPHFLSPTLLRTAITQDPLALGLVPEEHRSYQLCELAVAHNGEALRFVPSHLISRALCLQAMMSHPAALDMVPRNMCDDEMVSLAAKQGYLSPWLQLENRHGNSPLTHMPTDGAPAHSAGLV